MLVVTVIAAKINIPRPQTSVGYGARWYLHWHGCLDYVETPVKDISCLKRISIEKRENEDGF
jgi:hypothetical protein